MKYPSENSKRNLIVSILIILAALSRLLPHPENFSPIGAMALFGGTFLADRRKALLIPVAAMLLSDCLLQLFYGNGFHNTMLFVYGAFAMVTGLGFFLRRRVQSQTVIVSSLAGSLIFFFVTNFGMWATGYYGYTLDGLMNCMIYGIPFFRGTIMGDLFFNLILFGTFSFIRWRFPIMVK